MTPEWSRDVPTQPGYYWLYQAWNPNAVNLAFVCPHPPTGELWIISYDSRGAWHGLLGRQNGVQFFGPIPPPETPNA